jgi:uncharacterized protein
MKIDVRGLLGSAGEQRELDLVMPVPALPGQASALFCPAAVHLTLTATPEGIVARGQVEATAKLECSRCLAPIDYRAEGQIEHLFVVETQQSQSAGDRPDQGGDVEELEWPPDGASVDDELDMSPVEDGMIDIGPLVREVLDLALPMKPLCREDCLGLCPVCGKPLNDGPCGCKMEEVDPRLAALAQMLRPSPASKQQSADAERLKDKKE